MVFDSGASTMPGVRIGNNTTSMIFAITKVKMMIGFLLINWPVDLFSGPIVSWIWFWAMYLSDCMYLIFFCSCSIDRACCSIDRACLMPESSSAPVLSRDYLPARSSLPMLMAEAKAKANLQYSEAVDSSDPVSFLSCLEDSSVPRN